MPDDNQFVSGTIEQTLVSLAEGIADAQDRLNLLEPFDEFGRPRTQYHLPYLDFSLKVHARTMRQNGGEIPAQNAGAARMALRPQRTEMARQSIRMALTMPRASTGSTSNTQEIVSTLSGRFVSVPPNNGMPQFSLLTSITPIVGTTKTTIEVEARYADGNPVTSAQLEFNINEADTLADNGVTSLGVSGTDIFSSGAVVTSDQGVGETELDFLSTIDSNIQILHIDITLGTSRKSIAIMR